MIVAVSGSVGLSQRISGTFGKFYDEKFLSGKGGSPLKPFEAMALIRQRIWDDCLKQEYAIATEAAKLIGQLAQRPCLCACMVAIPISKELCLIQFDQQGHPQLATKDLPTVAIGSGQQIADPFLSFLRHIFWSDRLPKMADGIFAAYWTLNYAIRTSPVVVQEPKQFAVLEIVKDSFVCRDLDENDLIPFREAVSKAENHLKELELTAPKETPPIPNPPTVGAG